MTFDDLDTRMRVFETNGDHCVLPGMFMVARIDGRSFTKLTKETHKFEAPFDVRFRDLMIATVEHLMKDCGFNFTYGYTESDEISLLFHPEASQFGRKVRKLVSILAGEASAKFARLLDDHAVFDCRISELPNQQLVVDYFRWRNEDAHRNALSSHAYWCLRKQGYTASKATTTLRGMSVPEKNELLFKAGINFNDLPLWQRRGIGFYWQEYELAAVNQLTGEPVTAIRRRVNMEYELPMKDAYSDFLWTKLFTKAATDAPTPSPNPAEAG